MSAANNKIPGACPEPDELGRAGWNILHTAAAVFPNSPSTAQMDGMRKFIEGWSQVYACSHCAYHMRQHVAKHPPIVKNKREASWYVCDMHNKVNKVLGKDEYNCDPEVVLKRWHPSYPQMDDTPTIEEQIAEIRKAESAKKAAAAAPTTAASGSNNGGGGGGGFFSWFGGGGKKSGGDAPASSQQQQNTTTSAPPPPPQPKQQQPPADDDGYRTFESGQRAPKGALDRLSQDELDADPRTHNKWGGRPVFNESEDGTVHGINKGGVVRSGWNSATSNESNAFQSRMGGLSHGNSAAPMTGSSRVLRDGGDAVNPQHIPSASSIPLVPPSALGSGGRGSSDMMGMGMAATTSSSSSADSGGNDADISEIMKKVRACAVYCPEKDKNKGPSLGH